MNNRAIIKKVIKRKNKHNHYYWFIRVIFKDKIKDEIAYKLLDYWVTVWNGISNNTYIVNMKERYIIYDLKNIIKSLNNSWLIYKIK